MSTIPSILTLVIVLCSQRACCSSVNNSTDSSDGLVFVHIIYRHGDRNIARSYPNDPYRDEKYWPGGYGELTNIGKQQAYELGLYLRRKYHKLIANDDSYNRNDIYIRSTDVDRTLMSASYCLAGMFPPMNQQIWNHSLLWQAIPVHTIPEKFDHVLAMKRSCPLYRKIYQEYLESDEIKSIFNESQMLIQYLEKHAGKEFPSIFEMKELHETLWIEQLKNFILPEWTVKVFPGGKLKELVRFSYLMDTRTKLMKRLKVGFLIRDIFERLNKKEEAQLNQSIWMFSAHDLTLVLILDALGLFESQNIPDYASCIFFELHKSNGTYHVEIVYKPYRGEDKTPLEPLFVPNCGRKCPLKRLYEIYRDIIPSDDFEIECRLPADLKKLPFSDSSSSSNRSKIWLVVGIVTLLLFYKYI